MISVNWHQHYTRVLVGQELKCAHWYLVEKYGDNDEEGDCIATGLVAVQCTYDSVHTFTPIFNTYCAVSPPPPITGTFCSDFRH